MRVEILANDRASFLKPMADGLARMEALRLSGLKYRVLDGSYTSDEMLAIFRRSGALLLAHSESFGLPICEAQACGALVFMPNLNWTTAHWLGRDYYSKREPRCSSNFVIYENDPVLLAERLRSAAVEFNPRRVRETFIETQPELFRGDREELSDFLRKVDSGEIHARLHPSHRSIGRPVAANGFKSAMPPIRAASG